MRIARIKHTISAHSVFRLGFVLNALFNIADLEDIFTRTKINTLKSYVSLLFLSFDFKEPFRDPFFLFLFISSGLMKGTVIIIKLLRTYRPKSEERRKRKTI
jgi:hypothetical protein